MAEAMSHRGPDDQGYFCGPGVCLGHRRLSIIDLSAAGRQPMSNEAGSIWVALNGEVYNYQELRVDLEKRGHRFKSHTDTEVIVHLYEEEGLDCVRKFLGMFAFAIWDADKKQLVLARDRVGKKPLLYTFVDGNFCFASEFPALLKSGYVKKEINPQALDNYFTFGYIRAPLTIYKNVYKLQPAHTLVFKDGAISTRPYWQLDYRNKISLSEAQAKKRVYDLLLDAVRIRLYSDVPLGVFLSGGIDSSLIVGLMSRLGVGKIKTFSIGFDEAAYNELKYARNIARCFNTDHQEFNVKPQSLETLLPELAWHYGEPYADPSCIPTYYLSKLCKGYVSVALNGDGGDENFAGYERYQAMLYAERFNRLPVFLRAALRGFFMGVPESIDSRMLPRKMKRFLEAADLPDYKRYIKWIGVFDEGLRRKAYSQDFLAQSLNFNTEDFFKEALQQNNAGLGLVDRLSKLDFLTYLPDDLLVKVDIASMSHALEVRSPFLDHRLMEFTAALPTEMKLRGLSRKYLLKKIALGIIPRQNVTRVKKGFGVPLGQWFRGQLREMLCDSLLSQRFLSSGYFDPEAIKEMITQHLRRKKDYGFQLWSLLMYELWHRSFLDSQ
jgi:asparagine synthase (glutamine-hydrolysing)